MYIYIRTCMYVCRHIRYGKFQILHIYAYIYIYIYIYIHTRAYIYCLYCSLIFCKSYISIHIYTYTYIHTYINTCVLIQSSFNSIQFVHTQSTSRRIFPPISNHTISRDVSYMCYCHTHVYNVYIMYSLPRGEYSRQFQVRQSAVTCCSQRWNTLAF